MSDFADDLGGAAMGSDNGIFETSPVWPVVADVMACLAGLFVLLFVAALVFQLDLLTRLDKEQAKLKIEQGARAIEKARLDVLEAALAAPLQSGRITLQGDRIGIQGNVLFALASDELSDDGLSLTGELAKPLANYVAQTGQMLMVSGYTDSLQLHPGGRFRDNWALSQSRALTVGRALMAAGFPAQRLLAAGFGENLPVADNATENGRRLNRRVEIVPVAAPSAKKQAR